MPRPATRQFSETHQGEALGDVRGRRFDNALLADCEIARIAGATFKNCVMDGSSIQADDIRDILGVTVTLDCFTFVGLRLSPVTLDAFLYLLVQTTGNDTTRAKVEAAIDPQRLRLFRKLFPQVE